MMLTGKKYDVNGSILEVVREDSDFAYMATGAAIKKSQLLSQYDEYMDPNTFFNTNSNSLGNLANQLKETIQNVDTKGYIDERTHVSVNDPNIGNNAQPAVQHVETIITKGSQNIPQFQQEQNYNNQQYMTQHIAPSNNPEDALFRKMKKPDPVNVIITLQEKIPGKEFIRMMNDNFETSIIDYLAKDFTNKLLNNPELLETQIKNFLENLIYPERTEENKNESVEIKTTEVATLASTSIDHVISAVETDIQNMIDPEDLALMNNIKPVNND